MEKSKINFKFLKKIKLAAVLIASILGSSAYAENTLIAPTALNIIVKTGNIINVSPGRQQITNNSDIVLINGLEATFECKAPPEYIDPMVITYWFWDKANSIGLTSPIALRNASGDTTVLNKATRKDHTGSHKVFNSSMIYKMCKQLPEGTRRHISFDIPIQIGAKCRASHPDASMTNFGIKIWNTTNTATMRVHVECDNRLIPTKENPKKRSDGLFNHCCKRGWAITGKQRTCTKSNSDKPKSCSKIQRPSEQINEPKEEQARTTYSYVCPTDMYLDGKDTYFEVSYERRKDDEQWCYSSPASGGEKG